MKILILHNRYKQYGGEDTVVSEEFLAYRKLGHEVELFEMSNDKLYVLDLVTAVFNFSSLIRLKKKIKVFEPDVVHVHNFVFKMSPSIFWSIPKKITVFHTIHNYRFICPSGTLFIDGQIDKSSFRIRGLLRNIQKAVYQNSIVRTLMLTLIYRLNIVFGTFNRIDQFIFLTPFAQKLHQSWNSRLFQKSSVKPNFLIDTKGINRSERTIDLLFVGRLTVEKGILDIMPILLRHAELNIHIVGDGPCSDYIIEKIKDKVHIQYHGVKQRQEVLNLLEKTKFLLFPSIWFEGMPMTILEAYSRSVAVISRNIGAMRYMVNENTGIKYNSLEELSEVLNKINQFNYLELGENAKKEFDLRYSEETGLQNIKRLLSAKHS